MIQSLLRLHKRIGGYEPQPRKRVRWVDLDCDNEEEEKDDEEEEGAEEEHHDDGEEDEDHDDGEDNNSNKFKDIQSILLEIIQLLLRLCKSIGGYRPRPQLQTQNRVRGVDLDEGDHEDEDEEGIQNRERWDESESESEDEDYYDTRSYNYEDIGSILSPYRQTEIKLHRGSQFCGTASDARWFVMAKLEYKGQETPGIPQGRVTLWNPATAFVLWLPPLETIPCFGKFMEDLARYKNLSISRFVRSVDEIHLDNGKPDVVGAIFGHDKKNQVLAFCRMCGESGDKWTIYQGKNGSSRVKKSVRYVCISSEPDEGAFYVLCKGLEQHDDGTMTTVNLIDSSHAKASRQVKLWFVNCTY